MFGPTVVLPPGPRTLILPRFCCLHTGCDLSRVAVVFSASSEITVLTGNFQAVYQVVSLLLALPIQITTAGNNMALLLARGGMILGSRMAPQVQSVRRVYVVAAATKEKDEKEKTVGKGALVKRLAEEHPGLSAKQAGEILDHILDEIMLSVAEGHSVTIPGFGSFKKRTRAARTGRNPATGAPLDIPQTDAPAFTAGTVFKGVVKTGSWEKYDALVEKQKAAAATKKTKK